MVQVPEGIIQDPEAPPRANVLVCPEGSNMLNNSRHIGRRQEVWLWWCRLCHPLPGWRTPEAWDAAGRPRPVTKICFSTVRCSRALPEGATRSLFKYPRVADYASQSCRCDHKLGEVSDDESLFEDHSDNGYEDTECGEDWWFEPEEETQPTGQAAEADPQGPPPKKPRLPEEEVETVEDNAWLELRAVGLAL